MNSKNIGPTFYSELEAYGGLVGHHFSWTPDGDLIFFEDTPDDVRHGVAAVYSSHNPLARVPINVFSPREYAARFTQQELKKIRAAQFSDMEVGLIYDEFNRAEFIDVCDPAVEAGLDLYIAKGLLDPLRKNDLLRKEGDDVPLTDAPDSDLPSNTEGA